MTYEEARTAFLSAIAEYSAMPGKAPNPRDFEGPTQWADFDRAHEAWHAECSGILARARQARLDMDQLRKGES